VRLRRDDQPGAVLQSTQEVGGVVPAGQFHSERGRERITDARPPQQFPLRVRDARDHLAGEVVGHWSLVAGKGGEEHVGIGVTAQWQGGQPDARRPAVGARMEQGGLIAGEA
jgi:hypothetical protein